MVMDHRTSGKEFHSLALSSGLLAVLMVMDHRTSGKEFYCLVLSSGPQVVLVVMDRRTSRNFDACLHMLCFGWLVVLCFVF